MPNPLLPWARRARVIAGASLGAGLLLATVGSGCLHHADVVACTPAPGETSCSESSRRDKKGGLRHVVVERVTPGGRCDTVRVEQTSFDEDGIVTEHVVDERRCGVVDRRVVDHYDLDAGELVREVSTDENHDDQFDRVVVRPVPLSESQRAYAVHEGVREAAAIAAAHAQERKYRTLQTGGDLKKPAGKR